MHTIDVSWGFTLGPSVHIFKVLIFQFKEDILEANSVHIINVFFGHAGK